MTLSIGLTGQASNHFAETVSTTAGTTQVSGSTFVVFVPNSGTGAIAVTDSFGNTYTLRGTCTFNFGGDNFYWYDCQGGVGGASHVFTATATGYQTLQAYALEVKSSGNYAIVDVSNFVSSGAFTPPSTAGSGSVTTTVAGDCVIACIAATMNTPATGDQVSDATGFNNILQSITDGTNLFPGGLSAEIQSSAGAIQDVFTYTATTQHSYGTFTIAYKTGSGAPVFVPKMNYGFQPTVAQ